MRFDHIVLLIASFILLALSSSPGRAANAVVRDGDTIQLGDATYRLAGIDAPELDQVCIDDRADSWSCGLDARDQLANLIGGRPVRCDDLGPEQHSRKRRLGLCAVQGETVSLNQQLVQQGYAMDFEPSAKGRFLDDEAKARDARLGLWKGCFVAPQHLRYWRKPIAPLLCSVLQSAHM